jgi:biotin carboxyl carrier protein
MSKSQYNFMSAGAAEPCKVQFERDTDNLDTYRIELEGVAVDVSMVVMERFPSAVKGIVYHSNQARPFAAAFLKPDGDKQPIQVWLDGQTFWLEKINDARRSRGKQQGAAFDHIKAPMPGTVLQVLVKEGQELEANQPVVIMESMKMEMTLSASSACVVQKVIATPNQLVAMQDVLVELQALS